MVKAPTQRKQVTSFSASSAQWCKLVEAQQHQTPAPDRKHRCYRVQALPGDQADRES